MRHRITLGFGILALAGALLACKQPSEANPAASVEAAASAAAVPSVPAPELKSVWLDKHGSVTTRFGLLVPGGGKTKSKRGGFASSTGWQSESIYPTGEDKDLAAGFEILAKKQGAVLIPNHSSFGSGWKIIYDKKPYKAFVVKRSSRDECVLSIKSQ